MRRALAMLVVLGMAVPAAAQDPLAGPQDDPTQPRGPAPRGEQVPRPAQPSAPAEMPAESPPAPDDEVSGQPPAGPLETRERIDEENAKEREREQRQRQMGSPHGGVSREAMRRALGQGESLTSAKPNDEVPAGTIEVTVVDGDEQPIEGATVQVGIMKSDGTRNRLTSQTDADGRAMFSGLDSGSTQAYRVTVPYEGATYGAQPFRLEPARGHRVRITRLPTTHDEASLLLAMGHTELSLRKERLHVIQQYQVMNLSDKTYVFPDEGKLVSLPTGFTGFQARESMSDQKLTGVDEGFRIHGSIPPGPATMTWGFDLPLEGSEMSFVIDVPWDKVYRYRVASPTTEGMTLQLDGMPEPKEHDMQGSTMLISELQRRPGDEPFDSVRITVQGIPGPGPLRWIAVGGMLVLAIAGVMLLVTPGRRSAAVSARARQRRRDELLDEAEQLERMHAAGEIGPKYRQRRLDELVTELASILRHEAAVSKPSAPSSSNKRRQERGTDKA